MIFGPRNCFSIFSAVSGRKGLSSLATTTILLTANWSTCVNFSESVILEQEKQKKRLGIEERESYRQIAQSVTPALAKEFLRRMHGQLPEDWSSQAETLVQEMQQKKE